MSSEKFIRVPVLEVLPSSPDARKIYSHWERMLRSFISAITPRAEQSTVTVDKLAVMAGYMSPDVYTYIEDFESYDDALTKLQSLYIKKENEVYARHLLATRKQTLDESVMEFSQKLLTLAKGCNFKSVNAETHKEEAVRDAFIAGITSSVIRQRLLENEELSLSKAIQIADSLEKAQMFANSYHQPTLTSDAIAACHSDNSDKAQLLPVDSDNEQRSLKAVSAVHDKLERKISTCGFCGRAHKTGRRNCPAKDSICFRCGKRGHFGKVCRSSPLETTTRSLSSISSKSYLAGVPSCLKRTSIRARLSEAGIDVDVLLDSGSSENYIDKDIVSKCCLIPSGPNSAVSLASKDSVAKVSGFVSASLEILSRKYEDISFGVLGNLCADIILGHDFMEKHRSITFEFDGDLEPLYLRPAYCNLNPAKNDKPPRIFQFVEPNCKPIAAPSRSYSREDLAFTEFEVSRLLKEGIIEPSESPWRAQVLVAKDDRHKKRLVIDYSQTINRYTPLDAYPLPKIETIVNEVSKGKFYSTIDLKSAYHQVELMEDDRPFTAFEACGSLYQFCRLPFGVTNGVAAFQRYIDSFIKKHKLEGTIAYLDNLTIFGNDQKEHDARLESFHKAAKESGMTLNPDKCVYSVTELSLLGHLVTHGNIRPDPEHMQPLIEMMPPSNNKQLKRCLGMFAYYSKWISRFSDKIQPLIHNPEFPLREAALASFKRLKQDLLKSCLTCINENETFEIECDASDSAVAAILSQRGRPVAFTSKTLSTRETRYPAVEKEAMAIIHGIRKWGYLLHGRKFRLITDQKALSFIFRKGHRNKIKNAKLSIWKLELSLFDYEIFHRPGVQNVAPDAISRFSCSMNQSAKDLVEIHKILGHPGTRRLSHFVRAKNLPFSMDEIKTVCRNCSECAKLKPRFCKNPQSTSLIKSTRPWERISIDFKGPVPGKRKYLLVVVDEYSRFPFVFPCYDVSASTVIQHLTSLFSLVGVPEYVHSDRGSAFLSKDFSLFLTKLGIATSRTTPYHPTGNSQCERMNQTVWRTVKLFLATRNLPDTLWEMVLPDALHSIRSLLCTATNNTPHERFFKFDRRSMLGKSIPDWLLTSDKVLLRRFIRTKSEPLVDTVDLLEVNPKYALIRHQDGRESTVSVTDLAPTPIQEKGECPTEYEHIDVQDGDGVGRTDGRKSSITECEAEIDNTAEKIQANDADAMNTDPNVLTQRRSVRIKKKPDWYGDRVVK